LLFERSFCSALKSFFPFLSSPFPFSASPAALRRVVCLRAGFFTALFSWFLPSSESTSSLSPIFPALGHVVSCRNLDYKVRVHAQAPKAYAFFVPTTLAMAVCRDYFAFDLRPFPETTLLNGAWVPPPPASSCPPHNEDLVVYDPHSPNFSAPHLSDRLFRCLQ